MTGKVREVVSQDLSNPHRNGTAERFSPDVRDLGERTFQAVSSSRINPK
ncbi:hypothetical protein [Altererythrobacter sp. Root672]|nr:hypothetical protein [Altererythrobacter sp. Root672]